MNLKVADLCTELESELGVKFTPEVVASLGYLALDKAQRSAEDLEAFAQHAKRTNVTGDDVKLLTRRNTNLVNINNKRPLKQIFPRFAACPPCITPKRASFIKDWVWHQKCEENSEEEERES